MIGHVWAHAKRALGKRANVTFVQFDILKEKRNADSK